MMGCLFVDVLFVDVQVSGPLVLMIKLSLRFRNVHIFPSRILLLQFFPDLNGDMTSIEKLSHRNF